MNKPESAGRNRRKSRGLSKNLERSNCEASVSLNPGVFTNTDPQKSQFYGNKLSWMSELAPSDLATLPGLRIPIWGTPILV